MNEILIKEVSKQENISEKQVAVVLGLLSEGNTVPFIARYRKEVTGNLDEVQIQNIHKVYEYEENLLKRKEAILNILLEKDLLTDELKNKIMSAKKLVEVEDLYKPYKEKKKTKATEAIANGLEPLAKMIMAGSSYDLSKFVNDKVKDNEAALEGAKYIIAEWISDNAYYLKWIRDFSFNNGMLVCKEKKKHDDEKEVYKIYYDFNGKIKYLKSHQILAISRAEKEKVIIVNIDIDTDKIIDFICGKAIKDGNVNREVIVEAINDAYKRLIAPSIFREIRFELFEEASKSAISLFSNNLEQMLLMKPLKNKKILGFDPAFRTGCKLAVLDETGDVKKIAVIYPHEPQNKKAESEKILADLVKEFDIDIIAIGNGTASRESELFVSEVISNNKLKAKYAIVSEAGASVYSASKLAIEEFPELTVEKRSAISIGRRILDPLAELVKIEPKAIGIGQYQHDVNQKELLEALDFTTLKVVNSVGVDVNTASSALLTHVSGLSSSLAQNVIDYRRKVGKILDRMEIKKIKGIGPSAFEQAAGFLRINDGKNVLDKTAIHPESYDKTKLLLNKLELDINNLDEDVLKKINKEQIIKDINIDKYTLDDIIECLLKPTLDPRDSYDAPLLKANVLSIEDLKEGMQLEGVVRNIVDFGAFIDIGLKNDGLVHISKITDKFIKHPSEVLSIGDIVNCYVDNIDLERKKVGLSLLKGNK